MTFNIKIIPSNTVFDNDSSKTILTNALNSNIVLNYSCNSGQCGVCKVKLISGNVERIESGIENELTECDILTCCAIATSDIEIEASFHPELAYIDKKTIPAKVESFTYLNNDTLEIVFKIPPTSHFKYLPGQYIDLMWNGEKRSYSIANLYRKNINKIELQIKKVQNGFFSEMLFNQLELQQLFRMNGPHGTFFKRSDNILPIIFICTGTGFAPVKSMIEELINSGVNTPISLYWGGRISSDLYSQLPDEWAESCPLISYTKVLSKESLNIPNSYCGYVQDAVLENIKDLSEYQVYACGSNNMIKSAQELFIKKGLKRENFFSDAFLPSN